MFEKMLEQVYGIKPSEYKKLESYDAYRGNGFYYFIANPGSRDEEEVAELQKIAAQLAAFGDNNVPSVITTREGSILANWEGRNLCLMACRLSEKPRQMKLGRKLAKFHERGRMVPFQVEKTARIGQWKQLWETRLDQMEKVWADRMFQPADGDFQKMFVESFPYYVGLAENAIQYLVDTEMDDDPTETDSGTVCHERFSNDSWGKHYIIKNPMEWVFDHRSRDLAEWSRNRYFQNSRTCAPEIAGFFADYRGIAELSSFSWRLLYARLLFPVHYFETVEAYYNSRRESDQKSLEERLSAMLKQTSDYEQFVASFLGIAGSPVLNQIPKPDWLGI